MATRRADPERDFALAGTEVACSEVEVQKAVAVPHSRNESLQRWLQCLKMQLPVLIGD
jgi:hypothetical protein